MKASNRETAIGKQLADKRLLDKRLLANFGVPEKGIAILDKMLTPDEQRFLAEAEPGREYTASEIDAMLVEIAGRESFGDLLDNEAGIKFREIQGTEPAGDLSDDEAGVEFRETQDAEQTGDLALMLYRRGVIDPGDEEGTYQLGNFWSRLDIFATDEIELYSTIPEDIRLDLEADYLIDYEDRLWADAPDAPDATDDSDAADEPAKQPFRPTLDEVLPIEDVLAFIDEMAAKGEQAYLADCDCRSLRQACDAPRDVCITYRTGPYSYVRRGLASPITKEQAKEVVRRAEREGLVHTINPGGICSCCTDCCYLFRAARDKGTLGIWPKVSYRIEMDADKCIGCGRCLKRCRFDVFRMTSARTRKASESIAVPEPGKKRKSLVISNVDSCQGCGLCRSTCPAGALSLIKL